MLVRSRAFYSTRFGVGLLWANCKKRSKKGIHYANFDKFFGARVIAYLSTCRFLCNAIRIMKRNVTRIAILSFLQIFTMFSSSMKQSGKRALQTCIRPIATSAYFDMLKDDEGNKYMEVSVNGVAALRLPQINKGAAFTMEERKALHLSGVFVSVFYGCVDLKRWC